MLRGVEKIWEKLSGHAESDAEAAHQQGQVANEDEITGSAIRTDFILSAEIMVISLNEVADEPFLSRAAILVVVALAIAALVYGVVGAIVKMDDVEDAPVGRTSGIGQAVGRGLVRGMPGLLTTLSVVGVAAMIWVGGHIILVGLDDLGLHAPYSWVHHAEEAVHDATGPLGGVLAWLTNTIGSAVLGLVVQAVVVLAVMHVILSRRGTHGKPGGHGEHGESASKTEHA